MGKGNNEVRGGGKGGSGMRDLRHMQRFSVTSNSLRKVYWWMAQAVIQVAQAVIQKNQI